VTYRSIRAVLCSTSSASHVLAGVLSAHADVEVLVFTRDTAKARTWSQILQCDHLAVAVPDGDGQQVVLTASSFTVTSNPEQAARRCDMVILSLPAFLHAKYLALLAPHLEDGCVIVGLPGQCGFEFDVRQALGARIAHFCVISFDSLPWICRIVEFGKRVRIAATKEVITGAMQGDPAGTRITDPLPTLQRLLGKPPQLMVSGHLLGITLRSPNAANHPPMMYSQWKDWDGMVLDAAPLFYETIGEHAVSLLAEVNREILATAGRIATESADADLSQVIPGYDWEITCYGQSIKDKTSLMTAIRTNSGYQGIEHPMIRIAPGKFIPDFGHRFLAEDVPFGLVVMRGIAEIARVPTPNIDMVLSWSQDRLGKEYLTGSGLTGRDVVTTRCPQRYGFTTLPEILGCQRSGTGGVAGCPP
jgi:NAD/NADP octopine/nopaline dehydrogenase, alpha-helical domain